MIKSEATAPWESEECFPAKPADHEYGYLERGKFVGCSKDELISRCGGLELPEIEIVWHPESPRLVPVWTIDFLQESLKTREKKTLKHNLRVAAFNTLVFCLFGFKAHVHSGYFSLVLFIGFFFGVLPLFENWRELRRFDRLDWSYSTEATPYDRYAAWVGTRSTAITWALLSLIGVIVALQYYRDSSRVTVYGVEPSILSAGLVKPLVRDGHQWWRLLTAPLMHGGMLHFLFNASALLGLGRLTEALAGRARLAFVFILSALGGSLFSYILMPQSNSVGASGALLGLIGFLLVLGYRRKALLPPGFTRVFAINVALVVVMGIVAHGIVDNAAHFGGFVFGAFAGAFMVPPDGPLPLPSTRAWRLVGGVSMATLLGFGVFAACKILGKI